MGRRLSRPKRGAGTDLESAGFTLIEIMVAMLLLFFALAGIVPFFLSGLSQASTVRYKSIASNIARERIEEIRRLDYREITEDATEGPTLTERFGTTAIQRDISFTLNYEVTAEAYEQGTLKKVTVNVAWTGPPTVSAASITTMIHQQFLGPRGALLELIPTYADPLNTPFPWIRGNTTIRYHLAEADWGLVFENLAQPATSVRDVYVRFTFANDAGGIYSLGDAEADYRIGPDHLHFTTADGQLTDVWFEYTFNVAAGHTDPATGDWVWHLPDGYWELRAVAYNQYDQPGNMWRLRVRVENGAPTRPVNLYAVPSEDNETIELFWSGGPETDRARYVLWRSTWDPEIENWGPWVTVSENLDPKATTYVDEGSVIAQTHPWGSDEISNYYWYWLYAVDKCSPGKQGLGASAFADLPPETTTTTTAIEASGLPSTTTTSTTSTTAASAYTVSIKNSAGNHYDVVVKNGQNQTVLSSTRVKKGDTLTVPNLPAGSYQIYATSNNGKAAREHSFSLPAQAGEIVYTITN
jgi:type II secretory pathway pseudopilin PulG